MGLFTGIHLKTQRVYRRPLFKLHQIQWSCDFFQKAQFMPYFLKHLSAYLTCWNPNFKEVLTLANQKDVLEYDLILLCEVRERGWCNLIMVQGYWWWGMFLDWEVGQWKHNKEGLGANYNLFSNFFLQVFNITESHGEVFVFYNIQKHGWINSIRHESKKHFKN